MRINKKWVALGVAGLLAIAAVAYGFFTSTGSGDGSATVGEATDWQVVVEADATGTLTPQASLSGPVFNTVDYTITNTNTGQQNLYTATVHVQDNWSSGDCDENDFSIEGMPVGTDYVQQTNGTTGVNLGPGQSYTNDVDIRLIDDNTNQDDCQGVTVPITVEAA